MQPDDRATLPNMPENYVNGKPFMFYQLKSSGKSCMEFLGFIETCYLVYAQFPYGQMQALDPERNPKDYEVEGISGSIREYRFVTLVDNLQEAHTQIGCLITRCRARISKPEIDKDVRKELNVPLDTSEWMPITPSLESFPRHFMIIELKGDIETCKTKLEKKDNYDECIKRLKQKCDPHIMKYQLHYNGYYSIQEVITANSKGCLIS